MLPTVSGSLVSSFVGSYSCAFELFLALSTGDYVPLEHCWWVLVLSLTFMATLAALPGLSSLSCYTISLSRDWCLIRRGHLGPLGSTSVILGSFMPQASC